MTVLALSDAGEAALYTGMATITTAGVTAAVALSQRSRTVTGLTARLDQVATRLDRVDQRMDGLLTALGTWRQGSDETLAHELEKMRGDLNRATTALRAELRYGAGRGPADQGRQR